MNYGNANNIIGQTCPHCALSIDKHTISLIRSTNETDALARKVQGLLDQADQLYLQRGWSLPKNSTMVGAARVKFASSASEYITVSGYASGLLSGIDYGKLGDGVQVVSISNAACIGDPQFRIVRNRGRITITPPPSDTNPPDGDLLHIVGGRHAPIVKPELKYDYDLGDCAAQKLLAQIFFDARAMSQPIQTIEMSEILWRSSQVDSVSEKSRQWRTGDIVPSCNLCMQVLPQMLCDKKQD